MICPHCGHPNPNGYKGLCRACRKPLDVQPTTVAKKSQEVVEKSVKKVGVKKTTKKVDAKDK
jgi:hypothetical protein